MSVVVFATAVASISLHSVNSIAAEGGVILMVDIAWLVSCSMVTYGTNGDGTVA